jgi:hypothetical protein
MKNRTVPGKTGLMGTLVLTQCQSTPHARQNTIGIKKICHDNKIQSVTTPRNQILQGELELEDQYNKRIICS